MKYLKLSTLRSKLIFSFLSVALLPLLVLAFLNQRTTQKALTDNANQNLLTAASQTAFSIDAYLTNNLDAVRVEGQLPTLAKFLSLPPNQRQSQAAEVEAILNALSRKDTLNILSYGLLDRQGKIIIDTYRPDIGQNRFDRDYIQQPLKTGLPYVSSIRYTPTDRLASLYFSSPVRNASGQIVGVLRVRYNATTIQRIITQYSDSAGKNHVESFAILLDENYIRLARSYSPELIFKSVVPLPPAKVKALQAQQRLPPGTAIELSTNLPEFKEGLDNAGSSPFFTAIVNPNSEDVKAAAVVKLKTKPWLVVFVDSKSSFLAPIEAQFRDTLLLAALISGIVIIAAVTIGQLLAKPLIKLTDTVTQFTAGNLKARSSIASNDEIGVLAASFNKMAQQVSKLLEGLEERTRELELTQNVTVAVSELSRSLIDPELLLHQAISVMKNRFGLHYVQIYLLDEPTRQLIRQADSGKLTTLGLNQSSRISLDCQESLIVRAARTYETIYLEDASSGLPEADSKVGSEAAVPMIARGMLLGVLNIQEDRPYSFSKTDLETFNTLAGQIATALENARLFEEIQKAQERFRTIFEDAPIGMIILNLETDRPLQSNKAFCEMLGYTESELCDLTLEQLTHPEDIGKDFSLSEQMLAGAIASYQIEKRYFKSNREIVWVNLTATLIRDPSARICYSLKMVENITMRKQTEAALQTSEAQYREKALELEKTLYALQKAQTQLIQTEKMSSLGQLVAGVAHEINNPVNFIYGNITPARESLRNLIELLKLYQQHYPNPASEIQNCIEEIELDYLIEDFEKILSSMKMGADRIRQIVLSLRNFSRLDESEMKPVDIHEGIENTLVILQSQLKGKPGHPEIQVIKEYSNLPLVECYAGQLNQVFMNILTNAIDALDEYNCKRSPQEIKSNPAKIWIRTQAINNKQVEIRIIDNGPGMAAEVQQKLFDPFFTTKTVGKGTGLGLAISYQIVVEKHKGQLRCISAPGKGSEFAIQIPRGV